MSEAPQFVEAAAGPVVNEASPAVPGEKQVLQEQPAAEEVAPEAAAASQEEATQQGEFQDKEASPETESQDVDAVCLQTV